MDIGIRKRMIDGTKVLWSTSVYLPAMACALGLAILAEPFLAPFERNTPSPSSNAAVLLAIVFWVAVLAACWVFVVQPLKQLYRDIADKDVFLAHCRSTFRRAFPFVPLMAFPIAALAFDLGGWVLFLQFGAILVADKLVDAFRQQPIVESVDAILRQY